MKFIEFHIPQFWDWMFGHIGWTNLQASVPWDLPSGSCTRPIIHCRMRLAKECLHQLYIYLGSKPHRMGEPCIHTHKSHRQNSHQQNKTKQNKKIIPSHPRSSRYTLYSWRSCGWCVSTSSLLIAHCSPFKFTPRNIDPKDPAPEHIF